MTGRTRRTTPIEVNLDEDLRRIKSEAKDLVKRGKTRKAISLLRETYKKNHKAQRNIGFIGYIVNLYYNTRQYMEALSFAEKLLALDETDLIALSIAANSAQKLRKWSESLKNAEKILELLPNNIIALGIASLAAQKLQNWEKALEYTSKKIHLEPNDKEIIPSLGIAAYAAFKLGKDTEALRYSERYLKLSPENLEKLQIATFAAFHLKKYQEAIEYARRYRHNTPLYNKDIVHVIAECAWELRLIGNRPPAK